MRSKTRIWLAAFRALSAAGIAALAAFSAFAGDTAYAAEIVKGPYLMLPTTDSVTVCWVTDTESTGGVVNFAPVGRPVGTTGGAVEQSAPSRYHRVRVTGLKPYTRYSYEVTESGRTTAPATLLTAAPPRQAFHFVAYGDCRTQPQVHAAVLKQIGAFHPDFVIQTGDLVANGHNEAQWDIFWQTAGPLLRDTACYPALGNHEQEGAPYFKYFGVPAEYSFDYGDVHFVALDSNMPEAEYAAQEKFLRDDLMAHQNARWRVVFFHHTVYTCVDMPERRELSKALAARLEPIFTAAHVQLVINGHDHAYQRHLGPTGIQYIVTGGGGAPLYDVTPDTPYVKVAKKTYNDCEITETGSTITVRAVAPDGTEIDRFTLNAAK